jgi:hypothetical protein
MHCYAYLVLRQVPGSPEQQGNSYREDRGFAKALATDTLVFSLPNMATAAAARAYATPPDRHGALGAKRRGHRPYQRQMEMD